ncbi:MAG: GerMN domain-containing protein [Alistipes sp.]|nr:GerMN domain-containing protein [Alistipes sp.]
MKNMMILLCAAVFFSGCSGRTEEAESVEGRPYVLYSVENNKFQTTQYYSDTADSNALVAELLEKMGLGVGSIYVTKSNVANGVAYIYFNDGYTAMNNVYEVLFRAAVVRTLTQLEDVDYVYFYVGNKPLAYESGQVVGLMAQEDFIADSDSGLDALSRTTLTLYFADGEGEKLVENKIDVAYSRTMSLEKIIVEQIVQGPEEEDSYAVFPTDVKVLSATVRNETCYVNFDASFAEVKTNVPFDVAMYAVVNSLCELSTVNKVQFQLNGDSHVEFYGFSFDAVYERNLDYLK